MSSPQSTPYSVSRIIIGKSMVSVWLLNTCPSWVICSMLSSMLSWIWLIIHWITLVMSWRMWILGRLDKRYGIMCYDLVECVTTTLIIIRWTFTWTSALSSTSRRWHVIRKVLYLKTFTRWDSPFATMRKCTSICWPQRRVNAAIFSMPWLRWRNDLFSRYSIF